MNRPFFPRPSGSNSAFVRVNGKIRAREVRVIGVDGHQLGILPLAEAINMARTLGVDLVEVAATATPPVCKLIDFGKYRYEQAKRDKEARKHQHSNKVKEIQLRPTIDPHDFGTKLTRAIDFLCEEMKVKVTLKFRGREMAHKEIGFQVIERFTKDLGPYGHPDAQPRLLGRNINLMFSPLPRNKRAKNPNLTPNLSMEEDEPSTDDEDDDASPEDHGTRRADAGSADTMKSSNGKFANSPFAGLDLDAPQEQRREA